MYSDLLFISNKNNLKMKNLLFMAMLLACLFNFSSCSNDGDNDVMDPPPVIEPASLSEGLVMHFPFEGDAIDKVNSSRVGIKTETTLTTDRNGNEDGAYSFNGVNSYINVGNIEEIAFGGFEPYSFSIWMKVDSLNKNAMVISKFDQGVSAGWFMGIGPNGTVKSYRNFPPWSASSPSSIEWNAYEHVTYIYDGTSFQFYINGVLDHTKEFNRTDYDRITDVLIGARHNQGNVDPCFKGSIDDIRIYNRVLTQEEIDFLSTH